MPETSEQDLSQVFERVANMKAACYIRLDRGNELAPECFNKRRLYIGYFTGQATLPRLTNATSETWTAFREEEGHSTVNINQVRRVVEDDGTTLWFTFYGNKLHWTFLDETSPLELWTEREGGTFRSALGWHSSNCLGQPILISHVTSRISQVQAYQRTVRQYRDEPDRDGSGFNPVSYLRRLIRGEPQESAEAVLKARAALEQTVEALIVLLTDREFENLVDLIFTADGWQRITEVGGQQADVDGTYVHVTTGTTAEVQVKSSTDWGALSSSSLFKSPGMNWMYWVYHSERGSGDGLAAQVLRHGYEVGATLRDTNLWYSRPDRPLHRLYLVDKAQLARWVVRKGLVDWLSSKAR